MSTLHDDTPAASGQGKPGQQSTKHGNSKKVAVHPCELGKPSHLRNNTKQMQQQTGSANETAALTDEQKVDGSNHGDGRILPGMPGTKGGPPPRDIYKKGECPY